MAFVQISDSFTGKTALKDATDYLRDLIRNFPEVGPNHEMMVDRTDAGYAIFSRSVGA